MSDPRCADTVHGVRTFCAKPAADLGAAVPFEGAPRSQIGRRFSAVEAIRPCHMDDRCDRESRSEKVINIGGGFGVEIAFVIWTLSRA